MNHATHLVHLRTGEAQRLSPLEAFVQRLANFLRAIAGMKRRRVLPKNWKGHWPGLREIEWCRDQILAFSVQHALSGGSLDGRTHFQLIMEVLANYGVCPRTLQAMNNRFVAMAQFRLNSAKYIHRHIRRIARREGITLDPSPRRDTPRRATKTWRAAFPGYAGRGKARLASITCTASGGGGMRVLHAYDGGSLAFCARAPPIVTRLPIAHSRLP